MKREIPALNSLAVGLPDDSRFASGLRWTLWLSVLTAPCGYATSILLARISPEAIGEYGLLSLYTSITSVFLFLGGPAVAVRFIPKLAPQQKWSFFCTYLAVACVAALPIQLAASAWPGLLHYLFGDVGTQNFHLLLLWLADLYILCNLTVAALKAVMELKVAQMVLRAVVVGSFIVYAFLYTAAPVFTERHHHAVIWSVYFALTALATAVALWRFLEFVPHSNVRCCRLPIGFWRYTLGLQASSALGFLSTKLDYLFILNAGGVAMLGQYVALMTLVSVAPMFATFVLDSYLPSLTSLLAGGDTTCSERLTRTYVRLIMLFGAGAISFMSIFASLLVGVLGARYSGLIEPLHIALPFAAVQIANWIVGTVYTGIGSPQRDAAAKGLRTIVFVLAFWPLWHYAGFRGAIWAWGAAEVSYQAVALTLLRRTAGFRFSFFGAYVPMVALSVGLGYLCHSLRTFTVTLDVALWSASMAAFLVSARYSIRELRAFWRALMPGSRPNDLQVFLSDDRETATT